MLLLFKLEIKKLLKRKICIGTFCGLFAIIAFLLIMRISMASSFDDNGNEVSGYRAIKYEQKILAPLAGKMTPEYIGDIIKNYNTITSNPMNLDKNNYVKEDIYISRLYKYNKLISLIVNAFTQNKNYDYSIIDSLSYKDGLNFYAKRDEKLQERINENFTPIEKNTIIKYNDNVSKPFKYSYSLGWENLLDNSFAFYIFLTFILCSCMSSVYSDEYQKGTADLILSSKYGRNKVFWAKLLAALTFAFAIYIFFSIVFALTFLTIYGFEGYSNNIQTLFFFSIYDYTLLETYLLVVLISLMAYMTMIIFTLMISAKCKNNFTPLFLSLAVIMFPLFIDHSEKSKLLNSLIDLLPTKMLGSLNSIVHYTFYKIGSICISQSLFMIIVSIIISLICIFIARYFYKRNAVCN